MKTVSITEAKAQLSRLVEQATLGEPFIIAKFGKPLVKVLAVPVPEAKSIKRMGFLEGQINFPEDFDTMCADEIVRLFEGDD